MFDKNYSIDHSPLPHQNIQVLFDKHVDHLRFILDVMLCVGMCFCLFKYVISITELH